MNTRITFLAVALFGTLWGLGCTTVSIYQSSVAGFQTAVNSANDSVRPYLLGVNNLIAEANLYDKVTQNKAWGTEDLKVGIPQDEIQVRLQALSTISSYANALGTVANSKDIENLDQAAKTLGNDVNGLDITFQGLTQNRKKNPGQTALSQQTQKLNLSQPLSTLVTLFGTLVIEHKQKEAIEAAILNGDKPIKELIELLKADIISLSFVNESSYDAMRTGMVKIYEDARHKTDPKDLIALIDQFVQENNRIQTLRALQVGDLLSNMENAQTALVTFAKSSKTPKDVSDLSAQIGVFTAQATLFNNVIASIQLTSKASK